MLMMVSMCMSHILNNIWLKLVNISWWWWWFFGQNFENNSFLEEEIFKPVARGNNEEKNKIWIFPLTFRTFFKKTTAFPFIFFVLIVLAAKSSYSVAFVSLCSKLLLKTPGQSQLTSLCIFIVNFEKITRFF